jgi:hypothetical protein
MLTDHDLVIDDDGNANIVLRRYRYLCRCGAACAWLESGQLAHEAHAAHKLAAIADRDRRAYDRGRQLALDAMARAGVSAAELAQIPHDVPL